jgi:hypothetical protein
MGPGVRPDDERAFYPTGKSIDKLILFLARVQSSSKKYPFRSDPKSKL